jgi:hypothetical protein
MTDLEDRLRQDMKRLAERAQPGAIRPLREPSTRRRALLIRWLAPITAMAAVAGVIAGISLARQAAGDRPAPTGAPTAMPPYYVTLTGTSKGVITARVRDSQTGAVLSSLRVPSLIPRVTSVRQHNAQATGRPISSALTVGSTPPRSGPAGPAWIMAAADNRTFVITDQAGLFLLRIAADGRSARLRRLPVHVPYLVSDPAALSPDGRQLAIDVVSCRRLRGAACGEGIEVVSLATGARKMWLGPGMSGTPLDPVWVARGKQIMFIWNLGNQPPPRGYRLLTVETSGHSLLGDSRPMVNPPTQDGWLIPPTLLTPDGRGLITTDYQKLSGRRTARVRVVELSARTGQLLRVLHVAYVPYTGGPADLAGGDCNVLSLGPSGLHALIQCVGFGRLDGSRFTPLPGVPAATADLQYGFTGIGATAGW